MNLYDEFSLILLLLLSFSRFWQKLPRIPKWAKGGCKGRNFIQRLWSPSSWRNSWGRDFEENEFTFFQEDQKKSSGKNTTWNTIYIFSLKRIPIQLDYTR